MPEFDQILLTYGSLSIFIAGIIAIVKWDKSNYTNRMFFLFIFFSVALEILQRLLRITIKNNIVVFNLFALTDLILLTLSYHAWGLFGKRRQLMWFIIISFSLFWITEQFIFSSVLLKNPYSRLISSILITILSINMISKSLLTERIVYYKNFKFIAALGALLLYSVISAITFISHNENAEVSFDLGGKLSIAQEIFNVIANLLYAASLLWMIPYRKYTME